MRLLTAAADLAWLAFVFHEVMPPQQLSAELRRVVKADGKVAVLDWRPDGTGEVGAPRAHRVWPAQVIEWLKSAGFGQVQQTWQDEDSYLVEAK